MRPGVLDVLARFLFLNIAFIKDDLPTLERPIKQISESLSSGIPFEETTPL